MKATPAVAVSLLALSSAVMSAETINSDEAKAGSAAVGWLVVSVDGKKVLSAKDSTFTEAGMAGVWTKAGGATAFDDFSFGS